jgi:small subunit ribosomal protein S9
MATEKKKKNIQTVGTRKRSIARATIKEGKGVVRINSKLLHLVEPEHVKLRIQEPLMIADEIDPELVKGVDIVVNVRGGGIWGQADAARTAISNALIDWSKNKSLREAYLDYDRSMVISDARRTEPHKPSRSSAGPRRTKQQSKR